MIIKILSIVLFVVMISLMWEQCNESTLLFFTLSIFVTFAWLTPSLYKFDSIRTVPKRYFIAFALVAVILTIFTIKIGMPWSSKSICEL